MNEQLVEKVARAEFDFDCDGAAKGAWGKLSTNAKDHYRRRARAAIATVLEDMREPSEEMLAAAKPEPDHLYNKPGRGDGYARSMKAACEADRMAARQDWQAMLDAYAGKQP